MRIAIYGTGGVGGYYGARLAQAGHEVWFIARGQHLEAIRTEGLRLESVVGDVTIRPVYVTDTPADVGVVDAVLLGVKTWQVRDAAEAMRPMIGDHTIVLTLQNGVDAPNDVADVLGRDHVLGGETRIFSFIGGPGLIRHLGGPTSITFGALEAAGRAGAQHLQTVLTEAGITATIAPNIESALWTKLLFVTAVGGVGAVTRAPIGITRALPETRSMLRQAMIETYLVAEARKISLPNDIVEQSMGFLDTQPAEGTSSLQRDIAAGKPSELEAWNGAVVRLGHEVQVATPTHTFIYHSLLPWERRARGAVSFA